MPVSTLWYIDHQCPCTQSEPHPPPTCSGVPLRPADRFRLWVIWNHWLRPAFQCAWDLVCPLQEWRSVCLSPMELLQSPLAFKPNALGTPSTLFRPPGWGDWHQPQNSLLLDNVCSGMFFSLSVNHLERYRILLYHERAPPIILFGFHFMSLEAEYLLVGSSIF